MIEAGLNINVSAVDYNKTSRAIVKQLTLLEQMVHGEDEFAITDSEFAFGWHFFVLRVNMSLIQKLKEMMGPNYENLEGRGVEKKFLAWLSSNLERDSPRFKLAIKEEMESSKFGIF